MPSLCSRHLQAYRWPRVSECRAWASCGDGALACNAHPVPRASLSASHAGARQHTSAGPYVTPGIQATTGSGESQQEAGPTGAHGQRAGAEGKLGAQGSAAPAPGRRREGSGLHPPRGTTRLARGRRAALIRSPSRAQSPVSNPGHRPSEMPVLPPLPSGGT